MLMSLTQFKHFPPNFDSMCYLRGAFRWSLTSSPTRISGNIHQLESRTRLCQQNEDSIIFVIDIARTSFSTDDHRFMAEVILPTPARTGQTNIAGRLLSTKLLHPMAMPRNEDLCIFVHRHCLTCFNLGRFQYITAEILPATNDNNWTPVTRYRIPPIRMIPTLSSRTYTAITKSSSLDPL